MRFTFQVGERFQEIAGESVRAFLEELARLVAEKYEEVVLDFHGTARINTLAMCKLVSARQDLLRQNRSLKLVNLSPDLRRLIQTANMAALL
ncbi:MAG: STAS domain-containing protein, partial [Planctomycetota bacterium]